MLPTIHFDNEHLFKTDEINNESIYRALTAKFTAIDLPAPEVVPEFLLGLGEVPSQAFGESLLLLAVQITPTLALPHRAMAFA